MAQSKYSTWAFLGQYKTPEQFKTAYATAAPAQSPTILAQQNALRAQMGYDPYTTQSKSNTEADEETLLVLLLLLIILLSRGG